MTLTTADTRITVARRTTRWDDRDVTVADALDFWSLPPVPPMW